VKQVGANLLTFQNRWTIEAKCQNRNGIWSTYDIPFFGEDWSSDVIANAVLSVLRSRAPDHGLFMSEGDWKKDVLSKLMTKSISRLYQFGHCVSFRDNADGTCSCYFWTVRSRLGFSGRAEDKPVVCNRDSESLKAVLEQFYGDYVKPGSATP
jgi:hypothetical protein